MANLRFRQSPSLAETEREDGVAPAGAVEVLFTTTQRRLLGFLYGQPDRQFHTSELIEFTGSGAGAVQRELVKLEVAGLLRSCPLGARKYYLANSQAAGYRELVAMVRNTFGLAEPLRAACSLLVSRFEFAFVFEDFDETAAPGSHASLELMLVGEANRGSDEAIGYAVDAAEQRLRRGIRVLVVRAEELLEPRWFLVRALAQPRVWVFGDEARLAAITSGP